ncbi:hypothetical protein [Couchioplanes caeruleus]|uniref:Ig-like domain-containing protein n=2 Tax=Couchioplanes caeruleus TaxID=56438 RepID=A0A1K0GFF0_9ACTN|nr:hypothetical protein [Couchioplanes caeruleus]OJF11210.1 hypothetical protein BG844_27795 [Couchioplanes caeruleus subsp. caeruleus]OJF15986.1 hypothetical protein BG844_01785 [Couchioplanes caeruleus subsp. caeruleus]ROP27842.1 hypothetical protein EDD30_0537 [Couchioplanes caeruleus]
MSNRGWAWVAAVVAGGATALAVPVAALADGGAAPVSATAEPTTLTLAAPPTVARLGSLTLSGSLGAGAGTLTVSRKDLSGTHALPDVIADASGAFTVLDKPAVGGTNTYTVSWAGNDVAAAASAQASVTVSRRATNVTISTNATTYGYNGVATVTAKLGTTHDSRALCVYATPRGGTKTKVKCGTGTVTATYRTTRRTTFSAVFTGDQWYLPATATKSVTARARMQQVLVGHHGTSGKYKLYRTSVNPGFAARVTPARPGGCLSIQLQVYASGKWRALQTVKCQTLNEDSAAGGYIGGPRRKGLMFRIRAGFAGDAMNAAATGSWMYIKFTA